MNKKIDNDGDVKVEQEKNMLKTAGELKEYLLEIRDKLSEGTAPEILAVTAMKSILNNENIYNILDTENKEIARDIWLRIQQTGVQLQHPPLLFSAEEVG